MSVWPSTRRAARAHCLPKRRAAAFTSHVEATAMATVNTARPHSTTGEPGLTGEKCFCSKGNDQTEKEGAPRRNIPMSEAQSRFVSRARGGRFLSQKVRRKIHQHAMTA